MNIIIDGIKYQQVGGPPEKTSDIRIVILQRGWVFVGRFFQNGSQCILTDAKNYRKQGSGKGLGYTAKHGPSFECKLDPCETTVRFHELTIIATIDCDESKWNNILST